VVLRDVESPTYEVTRTRNMCLSIADRISPTKPQFERDVKDLTVSQRKAPTIPSLGIMDLYFWPRFSVVLVCVELWVCPSRLQIEKGKKKTNLSSKVGGHHSKIER
jgi:hypothetical protein